MEERNHKKFESIHIIDLQLINAACTTDQHIVSVVTKRDGIGLRGDYQPLIKYGSDWNKVSLMCINSGQLHVTHGSGVVEVSLATSNIVRTICAGHGQCQMPQTVAPHADGVVMSHPESHRLLKWSRCKQNIQVFAGDGTPGNNDGLPTKWRFLSALWYLLGIQQSGICLAGTGP